MSCDMFLTKIPIIHDIPANKIWIPPMLALGAYTMPYAMQKIFPMQVGGGGPFAKERHQIAMVHHNHMQFKAPSFYKFIHNDLKKNLPIAVFCVALWALKQQNSEYQDEKLFLVTLVFTGTIALSLARQVAHKTFTKIAQLVQEARR
jgi:hypothetical protein